MIAGVLLALIVIVSLFDINAYKPLIETSASRATGLDVRINGKMGLSLLPIGVSAKDVHVTRKGNEILSVENLKIGVELMSLLKKQLKITRVKLVKPAGSIVKDAEGEYNFEESERESTEEGLGAAFNLKELKLSQGALAYLDKKTGEKTEFKGINLAITDLSITDLSITDTSGDIIKNMSFTGNVDCREMRKKNRKIDNIKSPVGADKGVIHLTSLTMDIFGAKGGRRCYRRQVGS